MQPSLTKAEYSFVGISLFLKWVGRHLIFGFLTFAQNESWGYPDGNDCRGSHVIE
jgi:hypothetical protein